MKICFALNNFSPYKPGGTERRLFSVSRVLAGRGHEPVFTSRYRSGDQPETEDVEGVRVVSYGPRVGEDWKPLRARKDFMKTAYRVDADVYVNGMMNHLTGLAGIVAKTRRKPFVYTLANNHEFDPAWWKQISYNRRISGRTGLKLADAIVTYSEETRRMAIENIGKPGSAFHVIYPAYPVPDVDIDEKEKRLVWMARFEDWKRPEKFLDLAESVDAPGWEFDLVGFGDDDLERRLRERCGGLPNANYVGRVEVGDDWDWYKRASLFVNTSDPGHEGFSNTFVQSWLCGTPVASCHHDPDGLISEEGLGIQIADTGKLARKIEELLSDRDRLKELQEHTLSTGPNLFDVEKSADRYENLFNNISI